MSVPRTVEHETAGEFTIMCEACGWNVTNQQPKPARRRSEARRRARVHFASGGCDNRQAEQRRLDAVYARFPSCSWGEEEWCAVLSVRGDIVDRIADDIASIVAASETWLPSTRRVYAPLLAA